MRTAPSLPTPRRFVPLLTRNVPGVSTFCTKATLPADGVENDAVRAVPVAIRKPLLNAMSFQAFDPRKLLLFEAICAVRIGFFGSETLKTSMTLTHAGPSEQGMSVSG